MNDLPYLLLNHHYQTVTQSIVKLWNDFFLQLVINCKAE